MPDAALTPFTLAVPDAEPDDRAAGARLNRRRQVTTAVASLGG